MKIKKLLITVSTSIFLFVLCGNLYSQDRLFTYTYQSNVLENGQRELEVWNTFQTGKSNFYNRLR